jgi:predicted AAA+ superfamily ATPase
VRDSGLLHLLLNLPDLEALQSHPKLGASWEGFALEQLLALAGERNAYFWSTQSRAELDLMLLARGKRWGFEFKYQDAPAMTKSLHLVLTDLKPERVWIVYPGANAYPVDERVEVVPLSKALEHARSLA